MISQSNYNEGFKLAFILLSFVILFVSSAYASTTTEYNWSKKSFLNQINNHRISKKLNTLTLNNDLNRLAEIRLNDMEINNYFAHESPTNNDIDSILTYENYSYDKRGENLAYGEFVNEADVMQGWLNSKWHKYNIEYSDFNNIGVAHKIVKDYMGGDYVLIVTVFTKEENKLEKLVTLDNTLPVIKVKNEDNAISIFSKILASFSHSFLQFI